MENKVKTKSICENTISVPVIIRYSREGIALINNVAGSISKYLIDNDLPLLYMEMNKIKYDDALTFVFKEQDFLANEKICIELVHSCMAEMDEMNVKKEISYKEIDNEFSCFKKFKEQLAISNAEIKPESNLRKKM